MNPDRTDPLPASARHAQSQASTRHADRSAWAVFLKQAHADWVKRVLIAFDRFRILCAVHEGDMT